MEQLSLLYCKLTIFLLTAVLFFVIILLVLKTTDGFTARAGKKTPAKKQNPKKAMKLKDIPF